MARPSKSVEVLKSEGKSHRTKKELEDRAEAEKALLTGFKIRKSKEVADNPVASKEFNRIKKLLEKIEKNDDLYSNIINRYCILKAECLDFEKKREGFYDQAMKLEGETDIEIKEYYRLLNAIQRNVVDIDKQIQNKRKMMFDIEKENLMTVASSLRSIPKKQATTEEDDFMAFISGRDNS